MYNIGIIGIGFMGGSLAKSLSKLNIVNKIIAFDKNIESLKQAKSENVITDYTLKIDEKFSDVDIVFICTPSKLIPQIALELEKYINDKCIITDIGSTKKSIIEKSKELKNEFIGGHPMIGSERSGYSTSKELLFENVLFLSKPFLVSISENFKSKFKLTSNPFISFSLLFSQLIVYNPHI